MSAIADQYASSGGLRLEAFVYCANPSALVAAFA
jgi:hypothetical protein